MVIICNFKLLQMNNYYVTSQIIINKLSIINEIINGVIKMKRDVLN